MDIINRWTGAAIFSAKASSLVAAVAEAAATGADLADADLADANLTGACEDFFAVLSAAPAEVPALLVRA